MRSEAEIRKTIDRIDKYVEDHPYAEDMGYDFSDLGFVVEILEWVLGESNDDFLEGLPEAEKYPADHVCGEGEDGNLSCKELHIPTLTLAKPFVGPFTGRDVHATWRDGMLAQGRKVAPNRMQWDTLSDEDKALDEAIALRFNLLLHLLAHKS